MSIFILNSWYHFKLNFHKSLMPWADMLLPEQEEFLSMASAADHEILLARRGKWYITCCHISWWVFTTVCQILRTRNSMCSQLANGEMDRTSHNNSSRARKICPVGFKGHPSARKPTSRVRWPNHCKSCTPAMTSITDPTPLSPSTQTD